MTSNYLGILAAFMSSLTWAWASVGYSQLTQKHSAFAVGFTRSLIGLFLFIAATFVFSGGFFAGFYQFSLISLSHLKWFAVSTIASYGFADALFLFSTRSLGVSGALAITAIYPIWTALFGYLFRDESLGPLQILGLWTTVLGVIVVIFTTPKRQATISHQKISFGVLLALITSLLWAVNSYAVANGTLNISIFVANTIRMAWGVALTPLFAKILQPQSSITLPRQELKWALKYFVIESFCGSLFFTYGMAHSPLAVGSTLSSLAPVVSVPMAWIAKIEKISWPRTLGIATVVVGIIFLLTGHS